MIKRIPQRALAKIEAKAQFFQGKGWGAATTEAEVAAIRQLLSNHDFSKVVAVDVGANVGDWTASFLQKFPECQVIAFEPSSSAFKILNSRFQGNPNIRCVNLGLSDRNEDVVLYSDSEASGLSSLHKRRLDHFSIKLTKRNQ